MIQDNVPRLGHTITLTPITPIEATTTDTGKRQLTFRADVRTKGGRTFERTVIAKGRAHDALVGVVRTGEQIRVRGLYERVPANDEGRKGEEIITAICLPRTAA